VLLRGLANLGITGTINSAQRGDAHNPDCFASTGEYEIAGTGGKKLIGSAQMATRRAILQHGSIPLQNPGQRVSRYLQTAQPLSANPPSCLNEEVGRALAFEEVLEAFARAFREEVGARDSELLPAERENAERIRRDKYETDVWNLAC
jgi:lipoate-protein ligase A